MGTSSGLRLESASAPAEKHRILAELGEGGMAKVYLCVARGPAGFNKLLVLKVIKPDLALDADLLAMFLDEARLAARLSHPNVVQTLEISEIRTSGAPAERPAIVMEYLEGQSLANVLWKPESRGVTLAMKLRIVAAALEGLHYIHELADFDGTPLELVHRDVSPHNVFVTFDGQVKVLDFGIAKGVISQGTTRTDVLKGKIRYMAPEQMSGEAIDRRADVFSMGVILWEILTGQRIWQGRSEVNVMNAVLRDAVPAPRTVDPSISEPLNAICMKALSRDPADRHQTAAELLAALDAVTRADAPLLFKDALLKDVGKLVGESFAASRARTNALINAELKPVDGETSHERLVVPPRIMALAYDTTQSETRDVPIAVAPVPSRRPRRIALAVALVAALGIGVFLGGSWRSARAIAPGAASVAMTVTTPTVETIAPSAALAPSPSEPALPSSAPVAVPAPPPKVHAPVASSRPARQAAPAEPAQAHGPQAPLATPPPVTAIDSTVAEKSHCTPPFYFDERGIKRLKSECF